MAKSKKQEPEEVSHVINDMPDEELRKLAVDYVENKIFTSTQIREEDLLPTIFMPVLFGLFSGWTKEELKEVGFLYEYLTEAGPRAVNGYPIFFSCRVINRNDAERFREYATVLLAQREAFLNHKTKW
jgi:hypothetical protein